MIFGLLKCRHPFAYLAVERRETVIDEGDGEHEVVTYHLRCMKCQMLLERSYARRILAVPPRTKTNRNRVRL